METMDIMILLLVVTQSFPTNIRHNGVQAALKGAVIRTDFKIEKLSMCSRRTALIPNHNIGGGSGHKVTYPYYIPEIVHSHEYLPTSKTSHCVRTACTAFPVAVVFTESCYRQLKN